MNSIIWQNWDLFKKNRRETLIGKNGTQTSGRWNPTTFVPKVCFFHEFGSFRMWQKHHQNKAIYWRETLKMLKLEQNAEIAPGTFRSDFCPGFRSSFYAKLELVRASRRLSLLQTLCARRYEKTQQAELVGTKNHCENKGRSDFPSFPRASQYMFILSAAPFA